jgi:hypothetical protein
MKYVQSKRLPVRSGNPDFVPNCLCRADGSLRPPESISHSEGVGNFKSRRGTAYTQARWLQHIPSFRLLVQKQALIQKDDRNNNNAAIILRQ